ncbi:hypothetical protein JCM33374_g6369 [Metschnikowia sp. JCM 33374]|nr:hypothetical protein JCM33374_g6369 [Metschnikowia sp. JCM 33374]
MQPFNRLVILNIFVAMVFGGEVVNSQNQFTYLPFSFGIVLTAFKFEDSQENLATAESYLSISSRDSLEQSEVQALQAISVAEVLREPAVKRNRASPSIIPLACLSESVLELDLNDGALTSRQHYIASIDNSHQFRFQELVEGDEYAPRAWSVSAKGQLEYQKTDLFYQCHSGESYKIYDAPVHSRCAPVLLDVVELVSCQ